MKLIVKNDIKHYFKKGDIVEFYSINPYNRNYIYITYKDPICGFQCVSSFWKWHFMKQELNKNIIVL